MAKPSVELIDVLRKTALRIDESQAYQWGHMGSCNCGFLVQEITRLTRDEIHRKAMQSHGDWSEQLNDYCPTSGLPLDDLIHEILQVGFDTDDLKHLERLSDGHILNLLPAERRYLRHNIKQDVVLYLHTWADRLEQELVEQLTITSLEECVIPAKEFSLAV